MIAVCEGAFESHVQGVGAIQREDETLGTLAVEKLVQQMAAVIEGALGRQGHLMAGSTGIGQVGASETIEGLIDAFRFGEAGGGVIEVDHSRKLSVRCTSHTASAPCPRRRSP